MTGKVIIMIKKLSIVLLILLTNCIIKNSKDISQPENIIEKNMTRYVEFSWNIDNLFIVNMTKQTKEKVLKKCNTQNFTLVKIDTSVNGLATGTFRCH